MIATANQARISDLSPLDVLYEFDGPQIFTAADTDGNMLLVYAYGFAQTSLQYLAVPTTEAIVQALRAGRLSVREALSQPWGWIVTKEFDGPVAKVERIVPTELPGERLPRAGVPLFAEQRPLLTVRLVGESLRPGLIPASVIKRAAENSMAALKALAERALEMTSSTGRPYERLRRLYDLPAQRLAFNSFEISFGQPTYPSQEDFLAEEKVALGQVGKMLQSGLDWVTHAAQPTSVITEAPSEEMRPVLSALSALAPPAQGVVERVELSGRLLGESRTAAVLTRADARAARHALSLVREDRPQAVIEGAIRAFDKDKLTFVLRDAKDDVERLCYFNDSLFDTAYTAFDEDRRVLVVGFEKKGKGIEVIAVHTLDPEIEQLP